MFGRLLRWLRGTPRYEPGEIVWGLVHYEENPTASKDRPVLVVGHERGMLRVHVLSSRAAHVAHRDWYRIGSGPWDRQRRDSWVHLGRPYLMPLYDVRRRAGRLDPARAAAVARAIERGVT